MRSSCSLPRRAAESPTRRPARLCSVSSCSSRAQRRRSCSEAAMFSRSRCSSTDLPVATAVAALAAKAPRRRSSSSSKPAEVAEVVEGGEHADRAAAERERHQQRGVRLEAEQPQRAVQRGAGVGEPLGALRAQHLPRDGALDRHVLVVHAGRELAGPGREHELVLLREHDHERAGADQRPRPLDDQLEDAVEVRLPAEGLRDRHRRVEAADRALELVAAALDGRVEPRVVDRDRGPVGEDDDRLLVGVGERDPALLLRQVEVAPDLLADHHRDAEERVHLRVRGGEPARIRMVAQVLEPQRPRILDQQPEDPAPARAAPRSGGAWPRRRRR